MIKLQTIAGEIRLLSSAGKNGMLESTIQRDGDNEDAINALESVVLGHWLANVDVTTKEYIEGLDTALEAIDNNA